METKVLLDSVYVPSQDVVARDIEGELIIIPMTSGIGDIEDGLFSLNETGRAIWQSLDGKKSLREVAASLNAEFKAGNDDEIEKDVLGLIGELYRRKMIVPVSR